MRLSNRARTGLEKSIKKWDAIFEETGVDEGKKNCALCALYCDNFWDSNCYGCPICKKTKCLCCDGSPYEDWRNHHENAHFKEKILKVYCPTCKKLAKEELEFLKSLC